jgi:tetratricopeptide (TPR) repeat protein
MLLVPDVQSMRRLQERRMEVLSVIGSWDEALPASRFHVMLNACLPEGPYAAIRKHFSFMRRSGASEAEIEDEADRLCVGSRPGGGVRGRQSGGGQVATDSYLCAAASEWLNEAEGALCDRDRAFICAWAGHPESALRAAHATLAESRAGLSGAGHAFYNAGLVLASMRVGLSRLNCHAKWLASGGLQREPFPPAGGGTPGEGFSVWVLCERELPGPASPSEDEIGGQTRYRELPSARRTELGRRINQGWTEDLLRWGIQAKEEGDAAWAGRFSALALRAQADRAGTRALVERVADLAREEGTSEQALEALRAIEANLQEPFARAHVLHKVAGLLYEQNAFEECLVALDESRALGRKAGEPRNMELGFVRALCLVALEKSEEAVAFLEGMAGWPGSPEDHGRALFLIGWVRLRQNDMTEALAAFKRTVERYPDTPFAAKAAQLVQRLERM